MQLVNNLKLGNNSPVKSVKYYPPEIYIEKNKIFNKLKRSNNDSVFKTSLNIVVKKNNSEHNIPIKNKKSEKEINKSIEMMKYNSSKNLLDIEKSDYLIERKVKNLFKLHKGNLTSYEKLGEGTISKSHLRSNFHRTYIEKKRYISSTNVIDDYIINKYNQSTFGTMLPRVSFNNFHDIKTNEIENEYKESRYNTIKSIKFHKRHNKRDDTTTNFKNWDNNNINFTALSTAVEFDQKKQFKHLYIFKSKSKEKLIHKNKKISNFKLDKLF